MLEWGWCLWKLENDVFYVDSEINFEMYGRMLDDFFYLLWFEGNMKELMFESGEVWFVICGEVNWMVIVRLRICFKNDCCFVIVNNEFYVWLM